MSSDDEATDIWTDVLANELADVTLADSPSPFVHQYSNEDFDSLIKSYVVSHSLRKLIV